MAKGQGSMSDWSPARFGEPATSPPPRRRWRWVVYPLLSLVVVAALAGGGGYLYLRQSLPQVTGTLAVAGLQEVVTVYRDDWGVPHIYAENRHDLYFAQGFVTAQDRLFQMDLSRRAASGRLAEVLGEALVGTDKFFRALGLRRAAAASMAVYNRDDLASLQAYADGVTAYITQATAAGHLPPEFRLLGYAPEPWSPADSASIGKFMAYDLGGNWADEVWRYQLMQRVGAEQAAELWPAYPSDGPVIMNYAAALAEPMADLLQAAYVPAPGLGSNNWVLAGRRTATGKPLLANDPHLGIRTPSIWYQTHLALPAEGHNVIGVIFPGAPGIVIGHNEHVAWGVTNLGPDVQDLYIEIPNPDNPREFLYNGRFEPARVHNEPIRVKGRTEPIPYTVLETRHGPIITDVAGSADQRPNAALALRWTALEPTPELAAVLGFDRARNWAEFRTALQSFHAPAQNFVFAATDGTIAYRGNGRIPMRKKGQGLIPVPGWTDTYEWAGYIPFDQLPEVVNPPAGFIATANAKVVDDTYPFFISHSWAQPWRTLRIREVLEQAQNWTVPDMQALQTDFTNLQARRYLTDLAQAATAGLAASGGATAAEEQALDLLRHWNQVDAPDQVGATLWHEWYRAVQEELFQGPMGDDLYGRMPVGGQVTDRLLAEAVSGQPNSWFGADGLPGVAARSLRQAVARVHRELGTNPADWTWGEVHRIPFDHPLGSVRPLDLLLNVGPYGVGGSDVTVGAASFKRPGPGYAVTTAAPWRQVVDLADPAGNSWDVTTPGQSGHPASRHYRDQARLWLNGQLHRQVFREADLAGAQSQKLVLHPQG